MSRRRLLMALVLVCLAGPALADGSDARQRYRSISQRPFAEVMQDVEFAITNHNFRITGASHIGRAIAERHDRAFPEVEVVHFCNLEYARRFLQVEPDFVSYMPCRIAVFETDAGVVVETWLMPENDPRIGDLSREVNGILRDIVDYAGFD